MWSMLWSRTKSASCPFHVQRRLLSSTFRERSLLFPFNKVLFYKLILEQGRLQTSTSLPLNELSRHVRESLSRSSHRLHDRTKCEVGSLQVFTANSNYSSTERSKIYTHPSSQTELLEEKKVAATANADALQVEALHNTRIKQRVNVNALFELLLRASYQLHARVDFMTDSCEVDAALQSYTNWLHPLLCIRIIKALGYVCSTNTNSQSPSSMCWTRIVENYAQGHFYTLAESAFRHGSLGSVTTTASNEQVFKVSMEQLRKLHATSLIMEQLVFPLISVLKIHHTNNFGTLNAELADIVPIILQWWAILPLSTLPAFSVVDWLPYMNVYYNFLSQEEASSVANASSSSTTFSLQMQNLISSKKELSLTFLLECVVVKVVNEQRHSRIAEEEYVKLLTSTFASFTALALNCSRSTSKSNYANECSKDKRNSKECELEEIRETDRLLANVLFWQGSDCTLPYLLEPLVQRAFVLYKQQSSSSPSTSSDECKTTCSFHTNSKINSIINNCKPVEGNNDERMTHVKLLVAIRDDDCFRRFLLRLVHIQTNVNNLHQTRDLVHIYLEPYLEPRTCSTSFHSSGVDEKDQLKSQMSGELKEKCSEESTEMTATDILLRMLNPLYDYLMTLPLNTSSINNNSKSKQMSENEEADKKINIIDGKKNEQEQFHKNNNSNHFNIQLSFAGVCNVLSGAFATLESLRSQSSCNDKVFRVDELQKTKNENTIRDNNSCNNLCAEKLYTLLLHKPRVHVLKRICEMLLQHTRWELTSTPDTMAKDELAQHLDKTIKQKNEMRKSSLQNEKEKEFFCDVSSSQRELVLRQMCGHARALVRVVMEEKRTSLIHDGPEGAALTSGGLHDSNHNYTTHDALSYKASDTIINNTTMKPYIEMLRNAAFRVVEPSLLKYNTLIQEMICYNCNGNYRTNERVLVQPSVSITALQLIFHDNADNDAVHRAFLLHLGRKDRQMISFMRDDDALRAQFEMLTHIYRVIGEASALPTARHLLLSSLSSSSFSSSSSSFSLGKANIKNADEIFTPGEQNTSLTSDLSLLASVSLYLRDNCVVTTLEAFRLFAIHALLFHETDKVEEYLNVKCTIHRFDKVWHLLQQGVRTTLQIKERLNRVEDLHEVNETNELPCKELYELQQLQKRFLLLSLLLARSMCLAQFEKYCRQRRHTDTLKNVRSSAQQSSVNEINTDDFSLFFTSVMNDMPMESTIQRSSGQCEELSNDLDTKSRLNIKVKTATQDLPNGNNYYFTLLHHLLDKLNESDQNVVNSIDSSSYLSEWEIVGVDVSALLSSDSDTIANNTSNDEKKNNNDSSVVVNKKWRSHVYFPPSALLSHHVCAKWELIEELQEYIYMSIQEYISSEEHKEQLENNHLEQQREEELQEQTVHKSAALEVNNTVSKLTMWEWLGSPAALHYVVACMQSKVTNNKVKCQTNSSSSCSSSESCRYFLIPWSTLARAQEPLRLYDEGDHSKHASQQFVSNLYTLLNSSTALSDNNNSTPILLNKVKSNNSCQVVVRFVSLAEEIAHFHSLTHSPRLLLCPFIMVYNREVDETLSLCTWSTTLVELAVKFYNDTSHLNGKTMNKKKWNSAKLKSTTVIRNSSISNIKVNSKGSFDDKVNLKGEGEEEEETESDYYFDDIECNEDDDDGFTFDKLD